MYEVEHVERLRQLTEELLGVGVTLADLDAQSKLRVACTCKQREIDSLESSITALKDVVVKAVEDEHNNAAKGSQEAKDLANAELREIAVRNRLKGNSKFMDQVGRCKKIKVDRDLLEIAADSMQREHERKCFGKDQI